MKRENLATDETRIFNTEDTEIDTEEINQEYENKFKF